MIVNAPAERVFAAFTAWERQGEWIPFTKVRVVEGDGGEGSLIEAVTAVGPAVLRDEMRVVRVDPPYEVRVVHCGKLLRGPGVHALHPDGPATAPRWSGTSGSTCPAASRAGGLAGALARLQAQPQAQALREAVGRPPAEALQDRFARLVEQGRLRR